jgi:predicted RNA binding protein with dsRBD fold (UPF0201 family)
VKRKFAGQITKAQEAGSEELETLRSERDTLFARLSEVAGTLSSIKETTKRTRIQDTARTAVARLVKDDRALGNRQI